MKHYTNFLITYLINTFLLGTFVNFLPSKYVLTTLLGSPWFSLFFSALVWTIIIFLTQTTADILEIKINKGFEQIIAYQIANLVAIWGVVRTGLGVGISSLLWVLVLAIVANTTQFLILKTIIKAKFS